MRILDIELVHDRTATSRCDEGFLRLKRYTARNRREDGTTSREYPIDVIDRPALDAVAVCAFARGPRGVEVLTRAGLRPAALFRRGKAAALPEPEYLLVEEIVAGVVEPGERGVEALRRRGAEELHEEAGLVVDAAKLETLGAPFFMLPGIASEKIHLLAVEVAAPVSPDPAPAAAHGDGSPLEEGAVLRWRRLDDAIRACERGELEDAKSELAFRRLAALLDREIASARTFDAPPDRVFDAFTDAERLARWWGPKGFTTTIHELDARPGGTWRCTMRGPDGAEFPSESVFVEVARPHRLVFRHVSAGHPYEMFVSLEGQGSRTRVTWRMRHATAEECARVRPYVVEGNEQNFDRLAAELGSAARHP